MKAGRWVGSRRLAGVCNQPASCSGRLLCTRVCLHRCTHACVHARVRAFGEDGHMHSGLLSQHEYAYLCSWTHKVLMLQCSHAHACVHTPTAVVQFVAHARAWGRRPPISVGQLLP